MTSPHITVVNEENFADEVLNSALPVMIDFYAEWCGPCKSLAPTLEKFAEDNAATIKVVKINVDDSPALAEAFGIKSIPTLVTLNDGRALYGAVGNLPRSALDELLKKSLPPLAPPAPPAP